MNKARRITPERRVAAWADQCPVTLRGPMRASIVAGVLADVDALPLQLLTIAETARALRVSEAHVRVMFKEGQLEPVRLGPQTVRIDARDLERLIDRHRGKAPQQQETSP